VDDDDDDDDDDRPALPTVSFVLLRILSDRIAIQRRGGRRSAELVQAAAQHGH